MGLYDALQYALRLRTGSKSFHLPKLNGPEEGRMSNDDHKRRSSINENHADFAESYWSTRRKASLNHAPGLVMVGLFTAIWIGVLVMIGMIARVYLRV